MPLTLVERAVERIRDDEVDECWCVFDVESPLPHPKLEQAVRTTKDAERKRRRFDGRGGKQIDVGRYMRSRQMAVERAVALAEHHARHQRMLPQDNPSSTMYELLAAIERGGLAQ